MCGVTRTSQAYPELLTHRRRVALVRNRYPNATTAKQPDSNQLIHDCGFKTGCLFELTSDETEHVDVSSANPAVVQRLRAKLEAANKTVFAPFRPTSPHACHASLSKYHDPAQEFGWW